jgi:hypothetical protein
MAFRARNEVTANKGIYYLNLQLVSSFSSNVTGVTGSALTSGLGSGTFTVPAAASDDPVYQIA